MDNEFTQVSTEQQVETVGYHSKSSAGLHYASLVITMYYDDVVPTYMILAHVITSAQ